MNKRKQIGVAILVGTMLLTSCGPKYPQEQINKDLSERFNPPPSPIQEQPVVKPQEVEKTFFIGDEVFTAEYEHGAVSRNSNISVVYSGVNDGDLVFTKITPTPLYIGGSLQGYEYVEVQLYYPIWSLTPTTFKFENITWSLIKHDVVTGEITLKITTNDAE